MNQRARAIVDAVALDALLGEGRSPWHPVAVAGRALERAYRPWAGHPPTRQLLGGAAALALGATAAACLGAVVERAASGSGRLRRAVRAASLKPTFAVRQLLEEGLAVGSGLEAGDLAGARARLGALVSRPTADLPPALIASAAIESMAENLADSVAAPLLYFSLVGLPGAAVYRVVNTADAMFGYRGELEWLGRAAALADDVVGWLPSRLSALAIAGAGGLLGGAPSAARALASVRRDGSTTASPNAGRPMAAMAGALGRRLEKRGHYVLGARHPLPDAADVRRAAAVTGLAAAMMVAALAALGTPGARR